MILTDSIACTLAVISLGVSHSLRLTDKVFGRTVLKSGSTRYSLQCSDQGSNNQHFGAAGPKFFCTIYNEKVKIKKKNVKKGLVRCKTPSLFFSLEGIQVRRRR